jgi:CubicO group peptidase (beta-lactamase class C family)
MEGEIDTLLSQIYKPDEPGAVLLVKKGDDVLVRRAYGMADLELGVPMAPDMVFRIGSITKQFTAVGILLLAERGKLSLRDDLTKFLPDYPTGGKTITIKHLLTHTSGIKSYTGMPEFMAMMRKDMTVDEIIEVFKDQPMEFEPGEGWKYNNSGYILLGAVIEKVSGLSYEEFIRKNIFDPLGMKHSFYGSASRIIPRRAEGYSRGKEGFVNAPFLSMTLPYAAGSLLSNVDDLALWFEGLLSGKLIDENRLKEAWSSFILADGRDSGYGFGWLMSDYQGYRLVEHGGGINGFTTHLIFVPGEKLMVALLTNSDIGDRTPEVPSFKIAALALGKPWVEPKAISLKPEVLEPLVGVYASKDGEKRTITHDDNRLFSQRSGGARQEIFPLSGTEFFFEDSFTRLKFRLGAEGEAESVLAKGRLGMAEVYQKTGEPLPVAKKSIEVDVSVLEDYVGDYELAPGFSIAVTLEEGRLMIQPTGQPKDTLFAESESLFFPEAVDAKVEFVRDESGLVKSIILHQGGQKMEARKK